MSQFGGVIWKCVITVLDLNTSYALGLEEEEEDVFRVKAIVQLGYHYFLVLWSCPSTRCSRRSVAKHIFRLHAI